jgi:hypothetical protein
VNADSGCSCVAVQLARRFSSLGLVELKSARERLEDGLGDAGGVAALEFRVVGDADSGEQRDLFPS